MAATIKGRQGVSRFLLNLPKQIEEKVLRGAARAGAKVIAEDAKVRTKSHEIAEAIKVMTKKDGSRMVGKVQVKGPGAYLAPWEEYGTAPHYITVDDSQRVGRSAGRINRLAKQGTLAINGKPVGKTVHHPGAQPHPFLRPALDTNEQEAIAAAQKYINSRVTKAGIVGNDEGDDAV